MLYKKKVNISGILLFPFRGTPTYYEILNVNIQISPVSSNYATGDQYNVHVRMKHVSLT